MDAIDIPEYQVAERRLLGAQVGPFAVSLVSVENGHFAYGVDVHRPTSENEAFMYGDPEGTPTLAEQWGGHTFEDALAAYDDLLGWYAALGADDTPGRVEAAQLPLVPGVPLGDGVTAVSVEDFGHDSAWLVTDSAGHTRTVSRWARITLYPSGAIHLNTPEHARYGS